MDYRDIADFQIDCGRRDEQIRFLQSLLSSRDDSLLAWSQNYVMGWTLYTERDKYRERQALASGYTNWQIHQKIMMIDRNC